jgi:geranylgeranyl diphosphate synthase type I
MAMATARADAAQRSVLELVGRQTLSDDDVARVQAAISESGALDELEAHITALANEAIAALDSAPIAAIAKDELRQLAAFVSWRVV